MKSLFGRLWRGAVTGRALRRCRAICFEPLESREYLAADLLISEFMARNTTTLVDRDGNPSDWIEIHNRGAAPADLLDWCLTDDADDLNKWQFPSVQLDAGEYLA